MPTPTRPQPFLPSRIRAAWRRLSLLKKISIAGTFTAATVVAGLAALILLLPPVPQEPPEIDDPAVKPVISDTSERLSQELITDKITRYIALTTWSELTHEEALAGRDTFYRSFMAEADLACASGYQQTRRLRPETTTQMLFECTRTGMNTQPPAWEAMTPIEREARARRKLGLLWRSITPEYWIATGIAFQNAAEVNRQNNEEFRQFAEPYDLCLDTFDSHVKSLAAAGDHAAIGAAWMAAARHFQTCSDSVTETRFPLPPGSKDGPEATYDAEQPRPEPDPHGTTGDEVPQTDQVEGFTRDP